AVPSGSRTAPASPYRCAGSGSRRTSRSPSAAESAPPPPPPSAPPPPQSAPPTGPISDDRTPSAESVSSAAPWASYSPLRASQPFVLRLSKHRPSIRARPAVAQHPVPLVLRLS